MATHTEKEDLSSMAMPVERSEKHQAPSQQGDFSEDEVSPDAIGTGNLPPGYFRSPQFIGTMVAVTLMNISLYVGYVLPINVLSIINRDIGPSKNIILVPVTKTLGQGIAIILVGRLGDIFGRRWFLIGGQTLGAIGSIIGAQATSVNVLMGSTAFIGVSGAVQLTFSFVLQELVPNKYRGFISSIQFIFSFPFACFGPVMARGFVNGTALGWRWCYWLNLITCGLSIILFFFFYHPPNYSLLHQGQSMRRELKRLDYLGLVLYCCGLIMLMLGITWGGKLYPWNSAKIIGLLVGGFATLGAFGAWETWFPLKDAHPLIPIKIVKNKDFVALAVTGSVATMIYNSMNVLWPNMVESLFTDSILTVGWYSCALGGAVAFGQICAGFTIRPFGKALKAHWQMRAGAAGMCAFVAALSSVHLNDNAKAIAFCALSGLSVGYVELLALIMVPFTVKPGDIGLASGFQSSCRGISGTIATAIYSTVLANRNLQNIPAQVSKAALGAGLDPENVPKAIAAAESSAVGALDKVPGMTPATKSAIELGVKIANAQSFRTMFLVSLAFGFTAVIASWFIGNMDAHLTDEVARKLQGVSGEKKEEHGVEKVV